MPTGKEMEEQRSLPLDFHVQFGITFQLASQGTVVHDYTIV